MLGSALHGWKPMSLGTHSQQTIHANRGPKSWGCRVPWRWWVCVLLAHQTWVQQWWRPSLEFWLLGKHCQYQDHWAQQGREENTVHVVKWHQSWCCQVELQSGVNWQLTYSCATHCALHQRWGGLWSLCSLLVLSLTCPNLWRSCTHEAESFQGLWSLDTWCCHCVCQAWRMVAITWDLISILVVWCSAIRPNLGLINHLEEFLVSPCNALKLLPTIMV